MSQVTDIGLTILYPTYIICNREVIGITIGHHLYVAGIAEQTYRITFCHPLYVAIVAEQTYRITFCHPLYVAIVAEHTYRITICTCICLPL
jgi:23S rRNA pseudoU1915 N3-methylase RlmH